ncbi:MAG TPA: formate dehydrogenase accessory sulfurtransferase FdhD [Candidatus Thalassarchaeaceae archaeon]|jgi:FdhD protein|nr:formate dehydrogenase accessory sulfurtransferase FdhD [Candidatus Thalassarchaeaceae archaeon]DAC51706.1 MAG TPA: formate dehydrogenase accessory sulfurtransferase FdhD [Candidatus Poseidoniales archaeon]HIH82586.1 formate dehydrogenase accessory sulfurtransferase FdhD [Candidatus Thalassarchaeaceae archaeon]|tara:strand:- start:529 stop:1332 length:804 start_codon:yes stop_codon:yes gene_type:complete
MDGGVTNSKPIQVWHQGSLDSSKDILANEQALQLSIKVSGDYKPLGMLLRTPGDDEDLVLGWLLGEAIIQSMDPVLAVSCESSKVTVELDSSQFNLSDIDSRRFTITSSCGLCGRESLEGLVIPSRLSLSNDQWLKSDVLTKLPTSLATSQEYFEDTGGLHASALFDEQANLIEVKEDVGRHNALDKLIGSRLKDEGLPAERQILMLSGRIGYELVQKAAFAGIPVVAGLGAPSSMAVDAARSAGLTLIGFLKQDKFNVYSGAWRLE